MSEKNSSKAEMIDHYVQTSVVLAQLGLKAIGKARLFVALAFQN